MSAARHSWRHVQLKPIGHIRKMTASIYADSIELLWSSMFKFCGEEGLENRFLFGSPAAQGWERCFSTFASSDAGCPCALRSSRWARCEHLRDHR